MDVKNINRYSNRLDVGVSLVSDQIVIINRYLRVGILITVQSQFKRTII